MIAEYVRLGATGNLTRQSGKGLIRDVLFQICEREKARKNLSTDAETQLVAFEEVAVDQPHLDMPEFDLETLAVAGFYEEDIKRLIDHPLITTGDGFNYTFKYDFLPQYLRAFYLSNAILSKDPTLHVNIWKMMYRESNGKGFMLEHMLDLIPISELDKIRNSYLSVPSQCGEAKSFLFHLLRHLIDYSGAFVSKDEKTNELFSVLDANFKNQRSVSDLHIIGTIDGLNLSNIKFKNCLFIDTIFSRCIANDGTIFQSCKFSGDLNFLSCNKKDFSNIQLLDCTLLPPSNLVWEEIRDEVIGNKEDHVIDALRLALGKFWKHGRLKRSLRKKNWHTGSLGHSIYSDQIRKAMLKFGLIEEIHISSAKEGGYAFSTDSIGDLQHFMDNRQLTGKIRKVYDSLF